MNAIQDLTSIRDRIHREIVYQAVSTYNIWDTVIEFHKPQVYACLIDDLPARTTLVGVDGTTGQLVDINDDIVPYETVPLEILVAIHTMLLNKAFSLKPDLFV